VRAALQTAYTSFQAKNWDAAEGALRKALDAQPGDPLLLNNLSVVLARLGRRDDAVAALKVALPAAEGYMVDKKVISVVLNSPDQGRQ
jgi:Flp pilus assembly protein TadD